MTATAEVVHMPAGVQIDREAILRTLNLNPRDPNTQALLLVCDRYRLDPLLKHMVLIQGRPYVTRDGYLQIAHASGALDGIEILDEGDDAGHWWAKVAVYRKDMSRPFAYRGRYPKDGSNKTYGPEMAIKCAEVAALRRAFNVTGIGAADEKWDVDDVHTVDAVDTEAMRELRDANKELVQRVSDLDPAVRAAFVEWKNERAPEFHPGVGYDEDTLIAFASKLDELEAEIVGSADGANREEPPGTDEVTTPGRASAGSDGVVGEGDAGQGSGPAEDSGPPSSPSPDDQLPPLGAEEVALASAPCELCGSVKAKRVKVGGTIRCQKANDCQRRQDERDGKLERHCATPGCTTDKVEGSEFCADHEVL